jgi:hypothetical protein
MDVQTAAKLHTLQVQCPELFFDCNRTYSFDILLTVHLNIFILILTNLMHLIL